MRNKEDIKNLMNELQTGSHKEIRFDEEAIFAAYEEKNTNHQSLSIKILSIFGGLLACITFLAFMFATNMFESETGMVITGLICITGSSLVSRLSRKTIMDTLSVTFFITGFALLAFGLSKDENSIYISFSILALCTIFFVQSYILSFISILIINGCIVTFAISNDLNTLLHIIIAIQALFITFLFLQEAKIITANKIFSKLYDPIRTGMMFSFIFTLATLGINLIRNIDISFNWIPSAIIVLTILYVVSLLFKKLEITNTPNKVIIYISTVSMLLPTLLTPTIAGAILILLLSFFVNYKTGFVLAIIALIYFIGKFYYDLHFTLLTKSIILFVSGVIFLAIYFFTHKKLTENEKI
ncbi:hypothetical protein BBI01_12785 [Chryseobacterium artocarpi]|uniref:DUF4401 domain-containing protein n=1 Tax=Chryseobacterium artocarpi TaxID=1414727 RepID=A0A1B8ZGR4_9FLAO|nr:DUF4401 domain-containing protein [Chryseobacterium artocarpi]OCA70810.1 hypothetical protein BBI01_12785 [Chryseobacterium artocarpi]